MKKVDKWDYMKLKSFYTIKEMVSKLKGPPTEWDEIFVSYASHKGLKPEYSENSENETPQISMT
jgi:hypothetical protein